MRKVFILSNIVCIMCFFCVLFWVCLILFFVGILIGGVLVCFLKFFFKFWSCFCNSFLLNLSCDFGENVILLGFLKIYVKNKVKVIILSGWFIKIFCVSEKNMDRSYCVDFLRLNWILYNNVIDVVVREVNVIKSYLI